MLRRYYVVYINISSWLTLLNAFGIKEVLNSVDLLFFQRVFK